MAKKKKKKKTAPKPPARPTYPVVFETFRRLEGWTLNQLEQPEPSCFNGDVRVRRYRVTVEEIEEPIEVIHERLKKLWRESDNHHHVGPLRAMADKYGLELDMNDHRSVERCKTKGGS